MKHIPKTDLNIDAAPLLSRSKNNSPAYSLWRQLRLRWSDVLANVANAFKSFWVAAWRKLSKPKSGNLKAMPLNGRLRWDIGFDDTHSRSEAGWTDPYEQECRRLRHRL